MLKIDDRIMVAMTNGLGIQLSNEEVIALGGLLVGYRQQKIKIIFECLRKLFGE